MTEPHSEGRWRNTVDPDDLCDVRFDGWADGRS